MKVETGYGFLTKAGKVTDKYVLPLGEHPLKEGYEYVEVADQAELDSIEIWKAPVDPVTAFDPAIAIAREAQVFNEDELDRFSAVSYMVNELIRFKNFWGGTLPGGISYVGLKQMGEKFVANGKITRSDYDKLNGILKEQNIDLDNPPAV